MYKTRGYEVQRNRDIPADTTRFQCRILAHIDHTSDILGSVLIHTPFDVPFHCIPSEKYT